MLGNDAIPSPLDIHKTGLEWLRDKLNARQSRLALRS